ncbi:MAG: hypothetical protein M3288_09695, partial [Thermoproteota archaeon]|nr:hypothetical protein [Thermoproteota archaeon]
GGAVRPQRSYLRGSRDGRWRRAVGRRMASRAAICGVAGDRSPVDGGSLSNKRRGIGRFGIASVILNGGGRGGGRPSPQSSMNLRDNHIDTR